MFSRIISFFFALGIEESDGQLMVETKNILKAIGGLMSIGGIVWGLLCLNFSLPNQSIIPFGYVVITTINMALFYRYKNLIIARIIQIGASILLPFALQLVLGGFMSSGGVMLWSVLGLTGVIAVYKNNTGNYWLLYFFLLFSATVLLDDHCKSIAPEILNNSISTILMIINFSLISLIVFIVGRLRTSADIKMRNVIEEKNVKILKNNADLQQVSDDLTFVNDELKSFAYVVSHDLKAPLRGISSLVDFLKNDEEDNLSDEGKKMFGLIKKRIVHLYSLVEGILSYSRISRSNVLNSMVDSHETAMEVIALMNSNQDTKITIDLALPIVHYDKTMFHQIFQNLISNALKHNNKKNTEINVSCVIESDEYVFSVSDNGSGIDPKFHSKIFEMFESLIAQDNEESSTGIGLSIVKKIVELNGGRIWLDSVPNEGTTFYFSVLIK